MLGDINFAVTLPRLLLEGVQLLSSLGSPVGNAEIPCDSSSDSKDNEPRDDSSASEDPDHSDSGGEDESGGWFY